MRLGLQITAVYTRFNPGKVLHTYALSTTGVKMFILVEKKIII